MNQTAPDQEDPWIDATWAEDAAGPMVYITIRGRTVAALTHEQAHAFDRALSACLYEIRWHLATLVLVTTWGKDHLTEKSTDGYHATDRTLCGRRRPEPDWRHAYPIQSLSASRYNLCKACEREYRRRATSSPG